MAGSNPGHFLFFGTSAVIARSEATKQSSLVSKEVWIASLRSQ